MKNKNKSMYSIRNKKKAKHPFIIVGVNKIKFKAMGITYSKRSGQNNLRLINNPNKDDKEPSYLKRQVIEDFKFNFSKAFNNYKLSNEDIDLIIDYLNKKRSSQLWYSL